MWAQRMQSTNSTAAKTSTPTRTGYTIALAVACHRLVRRSEFILIAWAVANNQAKVVFIRLAEHMIRRFAVTSDQAEHGELGHDDDDTSAWYLTPKPGVDASSREAFVLVQFSVNGEDRPIRRATRKNGQVYTAALGLDDAELSRPVTIAFTYRTVTEQRGNLLYIGIEQPTRGIDVELDYSGCGIERVSVVDFIASSRDTRIERTPESVSGKSVGLRWLGVPTQRRRVCVGPGGTECGTYHPGR